MTRQDITLLKEEKLVERVNDKAMRGIAAYGFILVQFFTF